MERCICAAIRLQDGRIIRGHRHSDCINTAIDWQDAGQDIGLLRCAEQGFLTSEQRFVNRTEAAALERAAGLLSAMTGQPFDSTCLFSEDLY